MATCLAGRFVLQDDTEEGWVLVEDGVVADRGDGKPPQEPDAVGLIAPSFVNAHTHVADAFLRDVPGKPDNIPELVGPGGWKHRQLAMARRGRTGRGVLRYTGEMADTGTSHFVDFRENGVSGARFLADLRDGAEWMQAEQLQTLPAAPVILGRPLLPGFDPDEADELLEVADGIGLSGMRDFPDPQDMLAWSEVCHRRGRPLAVHVSEDRHDDIDAVVALDPAFVVHMVHANGRDLTALADADIPVVVCPRSNRFFGAKTPLPAMLDAGCLVAVGTDNGMLHDGDLSEELRLLRSWYPGTAWEDLVRMASHAGRSLLGLADPFPLRRGDAADLVVVPEAP